MTLPGIAALAAQVRAGSIPADTLVAAAAERFAALNGDLNAVVASRAMQARVGDHATFFRKAAVEITFEEKRYLVVPQAAILVLVRDDLPI